MKVNFKLILPGILFITGCLVFATGCNKESGELGTVPTASFTVAPVPGKINTFVLTSTSQNAFRYQWESGDGSAAKAGGVTDTVYYLKKGDYPAKLYAYGRGGYTVATQTVTVAADDPSSQLNNPTFQKLIAHPWKFEPSPTGAAIIVGIETNPGTYYGGGPLADCQLDDTYSFTSISSTEYRVSYDAKGSTFNGGNVAPNYSCATDRSYNMSFTFSTIVDGEGIATLTLPGANPPDKFIGVTDIPSNNYRIISITETSMVLRAGTKDGTVFQFKFVAP
ncbi:MAG: hypothetical protein V4717_21845 [Bacteroidota bacterium]